MADNGSRGPNDSFRRSGRRRREPPIIDAAATEVPPDDTAPAERPSPPVSDPAQDETRKPAMDGSSTESEPPHDTGPSAGEVSPADPPPDAPAAHASDEPVLFGSAIRDSQRQPEPKDDAPQAEEPRETPPAEAVAVPEAGPASEPRAPEPVGPLPTTEDERPPAGVRATAMPPPSRSGSTTLTAGLAVAAVILLGIIGWLVTAGGDRGGDLAATVADLKTKVASLEARPDPTALQNQVAALDKRVAAAEADRAALGKQVATLAARIDGAGQAPQAPAAAPAAPAGTAPGDQPPATASAQPPSGQAGAAPALATAAAVTTLATKVEGIDDRLSALSTAQAGTAKTVAALPAPVAPDLAPVNTKVATLENEVNDIETKVNGSDARLNGFDAKINGIDAKVNDFVSAMNAMSARMNGLDARVDDGSAGVAKLRSDILNLPKVDLGPLLATDAALDGRLVKLENQLAAPKDGARVTEARAVGTADLSKATPIALVGQAIERAIAAGKPYGPEIDALNTLGADPALVARLGPPAAGGVPSVDALSSQWDASRDGVLATMKPIAPGAGGALNRFLAGATSIVQVRRVGEAPGADTNALVGQIDAALGQGDVAAALAAWDKLPEAAKAASRGWGDAARGRLDAIGAADDLVQGAIATLGRPPT